MFKNTIILIFVCLSNCCTGQELKDSLLALFKTYILFESNTYVLTPEHLEKIKTFRDTFPALQGKHYFIEGYTDNQGSFEFNQGLSEKRAKSVYDALINLNVPDDKIQWKAYGKSKPTFDNKSEEGKRLNRRTDINIGKTFKLRYLSGKISADSLIKGMKAWITVQNKMFSDSVQTDSAGNFKIYVPINQKLNIQVISEKYFATSLDINTSNELFIKPLEITLQAIRLNRTFELKDINFVGNEAIILNESKDAVNTLIRNLQLNADVCFEIAGHINLPGNPVYSGFYYDLSVNRAKAIYTILEANKIKESRMVYNGYSNLYMKYPNPKTESEMKKNRRVEIIIKDCSDLKNPYKEH